MAAQGGWDETHSRILYILEDHPSFYKLGKGVFKLGLMIQEGMMVWAELLEALSITSRVPDRIFLVQLRK